MSERTEIIAATYMKIIILGKIISKDNQRRGVSRTGKFFVRKEYQQFERMVRVQAMQQWHRPPLVGDVRVHIKFYFPNRQRVDIFNAPKSLCDALNGLVWEDDKQIVHGVLEVHYDKENPRAEITVF